MTKTLIVLLVTGWAATVSAQTIVRNPRAVTFECPDHATDDNHEIDIVRVSDGVIVQTLQGGDPPADATGTVTVTLNVQPVAFGQYTLRVRAVAGGIKSDSSDSSDIWERAPGKPTSVKVGG